MNTAEKIISNIREILRKIKDVNVQIGDDIAREMACAVSSDEGILWNERMMRDLQDTQGESSGGWDVYQPSFVVPSELLLGMAEVENPLDKNNVTDIFLEKIPNYHKEGNYFRIPKLANMNQALFLDAVVEEGKDLAAELYRSILTRMMRFLPLGTAKIIFIDPADLGENLGSLMNLTDPRNTSLCSCHVDSDDIYHAISDLFDYVTHVLQTYTSAGCRDIFEYNESRPADQQISRRFLVIFDYPKKLDSRSLEKLDTIINKAANCGISVFLCRDKEEELDRYAKELVENALSGFEKIFVANNRITTMLDENIVPLEITAAPATPEFFIGMEEAYFSAPVSNNSFNSIFSVDAFPESRDCTEKLLLPFAIDEKGELISFELNTTNCPHGFISGGTGSGKSSVLHMLIASALLHYRPQDLELWLVDYKINEFSLYANHCPKHIRYVIFDKSEEISYDFIRQLNEELEYRQKLFKETGVSDYPAYIYQECYKHDSRKGEKLPRILVMIDETHNLSHVASEDPELKNMINKLFAELRAYGINLLLADQSSRSGLGGFSANTADQISTRIALRNATDEIQTTLRINQTTEELRKLINITADKNTDAGTLLFQNADSQIVQLKSIFLDTKDRTTLPALVNAVNNRYKDFERNHDFYYDKGRSYMEKKKIMDFEAKYPGNPALEGQRFYIGTPLGLRYCFHMNLNPNHVSGENVLIVGPNHEMKYALINSIGASASRYGYRTTILGSVKSPLYAQYPDLFDDIGNKKGITAFSQVCHYIGEKADMIDRCLSEFDDDDDEEEENFPSENTFIIISDMERLMQSMSKCRITSRREALAEYERRLQESRRQNEVTGPAGSGENDALAGQPEIKEETPIEERLSQLLAMAKETDGILESISNDDSSGPSETEVKKPKYDARDDLYTIISKGYLFGIHVVCVMDGASLAKQKRSLFEDHFNHRIVMPMNLDEASVILNHTKVLSGLNDANETSQAVYECNRGREQAFRPFKFTEI